VSFAAIILHNPSQWALSVALFSTILGFLMQEQCICNKFCFKLGKTLWKHTKCSEQHLITIPLAEHILLSSSFSSNFGKFRFKLARTKVIPPQVAQTKM
jgi:hypothetical protein